MEGEDREKIAQQAKEEEIRRDRADHPKQYEELDAFQGHTSPAKKEEPLTDEEVVRRDRADHPKQYEELDRWQQS